MELLYFASFSQEKVSAVIVNVDEYYMKLPTFDKLVQSNQEAFNDALDFSGIALFEMGDSQQMIWRGGYSDDEKTPHTIDTQFSIASV